jgi:hypothetical protein
LFSIPFLESGENLNRLIRVENKNELFYHAATKQCFVETNVGKAALDASEGLAILFNTTNGSVKYSFLKGLNMDHVDSDKLTLLNMVKRYIFRQKKQWNATGNNLLLPPFGENIIDTLSYSPDVAAVTAWMKKEFAKFGMEYVLDMSDSSIKIQRRLDAEKVMSLPYSSIADTLQRVIFYKTAIASNKNSVLLFEEPEAHAFPPYVRAITQDIIESTKNQFFITTHSPFVINDFLEYRHIREELSIFLIGFKDGQTTAKRLSDEEMNEIYDYGIDLFFSLENYL